MDMETHFTQNFFPEMKYMKRSHTFKITKLTEIEQQDPDI